LRVAIFVCALLIAWCAEVTSQQAQLQIIHNAADPAAFVVDVYVNDVLVIDDLTFRTASAFVDVPANVDNAISLAFRESTSVYDAFATYLVRLPVGKHFAVAGGVYQPTEFEPCPDPNAKPIAFTVMSFENRRTTSAASSTVDLCMIHGVTDAPALDVSVGAQSMASALSYGHASAYITTAAEETAVQVSAANGQSMGRFTADLRSYAGSALGVVASGFLNPAANKQGPAFGLWLSLPAGGSLVPLTPVTSRVEVTNALSTLLLAPNPCTSYVCVHGAEERERISIRDMLGKLMLDVSASSANDVCTVNTAALAPGTYIVIVGATTQLLHVVR